MKGTFGALLFHLIYHLTLGESLRDDSKYENYPGDAPKLFYSTFLHLRISFHPSNTRQYDESKHRE